LPSSFSALYCLILFSPILSALVFLEPSILVMNIRTGSDRLPWLTGHKLLVSPLFLGQTLVYP
jgi:hypothetical protein